MTEQRIIAHYRITAKLGEGGMGEVWRATDTKLGRDVAIKLIPEAFSQDADRMTRFTREAQVLAALNHPNIAAIYGVEENALVMELVEGPSLAERIAQGAIPVDDALPIARQIAEALEYAHDRGIIHRDIKPANIKISPEGRVKVLDFGLAKALANESASGNPGASPTLSMRATMAGVILGTAAYMAPEQARGQEADKRADIWSFGVVLYEMLTGRQTFAGDTVSDTLAAVLRAELDWTLLPKEIPTPIRRLLRRCLERDRKRRLADIADALLEIDEALAGSSEPAAAIAEVGAHGISRWWAGVAALFALAALTLAAVHFREKTPEREAMRFQIPAPEKASLGSGGMALSPDGRRLVFVTNQADGRTLLWVRALDSLAPQALPGTDSATAPFWSSDSRFIGFFVPGKLKKIEASGGPPQTLCDVPGTGVGGSWNRDGVIIFGTNGTGLFRVPQAGGATAQLTTLDRSREESFHARPWFLPDGEHFLFCARSRQPENDAIYLATLEGKDRKRLVGAREAAAFASPTNGTEKGHLLFLRDGTLMAQPLNAGSFDPAGEAFPIAEQVGYFITNAYFSASANGALVYRSGGGASTQLAWFDREGKPLGVVGPPGVYAEIEPSPDGRRVAAAKQDMQTGNRDIWLLDLEHGVPTRFTFDPAFERDPVWSPDGSSVVFDSVRDGRYNLYKKDSGGARNEELLLKTDSEKHAYGYSEDGRFLVYGAFDTKTRWDLWVLPIDGDRKPAVLLNTQFNETQAQFSPGPAGVPRWVAYSSDESGRYEVYVQPFAVGSSAPGGKFQISSEGGSQPRWRRDGRELFYLSPDGRLMAVEVKMSPPFQHGVAKALFSPRILGGGLLATASHRYFPTPDGKRFLINTEAQEAVSAPITVVLNWTAGLKR